MFHLESLQSMVKRCSFNKYHNTVVKSLEPKFSELMSCQSRFILGLVSTSSITIDELTGHFHCLESAMHSLHNGYNEARAHFVERAFQSDRKIHYDDYLSHDFVIFQLDAIVQLLKSTIAMESTSTKATSMRIVTVLKELWTFQSDWARCLSAMKSVLVIGIGSIFVMIPRLSNMFVGGQWILMALCMTQGDTVGSAFINMKMRFLGTLLGKFQELS